MGILKEAGLLSAGAPDRLFFFLGITPIYARLLESRIFLGSYVSPELQALIQEYGYWIIAFAALIEGESILIAGGIAAHMGLLSLPVMIFLAIIGSMVHDHLFFFLGRYWGTELLKRWDALHRKVEKILISFERYGTWLILSFRYAYGVRTIIPTVIGMTSVATKRFFCLNLIGCILWSHTFLVGGYCFGPAFEALSRRVSKEQILGWPLIFIFAGGFLLFWFWRLTRPLRGRFYKMRS